MRLLSNTTLVFSLALVFALAIPGYAQGMQSLVVPLLVASMILSLREVSFKWSDITQNIKPMGLSMALNYVLLSATTVILAVFFIEDPDYMLGFIVMASMPPPAGVVAFTKILGGDTKLSVLSQLSSYLASLALTPLIILAFAQVLVDVGGLVELLAWIIIFPLLASRFIARIKLRVFDYSKEILNLIFFLIIYVIVGLNEIEVSDLHALIPVLAVLFLRTFGLAQLTRSAFKKHPYPERIVYCVFSSFKNAGATAATALMLFGPKAALPAGLSSIYEIALLIYLSKLIRK